MKIRVTGICLGLAQILSAAEGQKNSPNILFICVDDLRPDLPVYGESVVIAPEIERLAEDGIVFSRHYVNNPICIPSRASLLTGTRSERTHQLYGPTVWTKTDGIEPMGRTFKAAGYKTVSIGKVWHTEDGKIADEFDFNWHPNWADGYRGENLYAGAGLKDKTWGQLKKVGRPLPAAEHEDVSDEAYPDGRTAAKTIEKLRVLSGQDQPFLLFCGFQKPHLPFACPKKYYDLYKNVEIPLPPVPDWPEGMSVWAHNNFNDLSNYDPCPGINNPLTDRQTRDLKRSYYACISFVDTQIGKVLDALHDTGLDKDTIVVLWGDHGWHLGDQGLWAKGTNFERATHGPLIFRFPKSMGMDQGKTDAFVETVDIYPTLLELCSIPEPPVIDGQSFLPVLQDLETPWKTEIYHMFERWKSFITGEPAKGIVVGYAVRNDRYRYVEWVQGWNIKDPNRIIVDQELYDYQENPDETRNIADSPECRDILKDLQKKLVRGQKRMDVSPTQ